MKNWGKASERDRETKNDKIDRVRRIDSGGERGDRKVGGVAARHWRGCC